MKRQFTQLSCFLLLVACGEKKAAQPAPTGRAPAPATSASAPLSSASQAPAPPLPNVFRTFIVDWRPEHRIELETTMKRGLCLLQVDANGIHPVKECKGPGTYAYTAGVRSEKQVILSTADEIRTTLPSYGAGIAAKLEPELKNGRALVLGLIDIGSVHVAWKRLTRLELTGECSRATHFVRAAALGAFTVRVGTKGRVETMGDAMEGPSSPGHTLLQRAGSFEACQSARSNDPSPPQGCDSILGIELQKID